MKLRALRRHIVVGLFALAANITPGVAQVRVQVQVQGGPVGAEGELAPVRWGLEPPNDQDAVAWLKRASDAAAAGDWKLAADTLERVVDQHGNRTVSLDNAHYYSASHFVYEQIANWPEEGLMAYRLLYDPDATRLLEQAKAGYDFDALRLITRKYAMSTPAPEAMNLLATWLLDRHQPREALETLARLEKLPHSGIPPWEIALKRAVAYCETGRRAMAADVLEKVTKSAQGDVALPEDWASRVESIRRFCEAKKFDDDQANHSLISQWQHRLGPAEWSGRLAPINPIITQDDGWNAPLPGAERFDSQHVARIMRRRARPPVWQAVSDGQRIFMTCPAGLMARDVSTFDLLWQAFPKAKSRNPKINEHRAMVNFGGQTIYFEDDDDSPRLDPLTTQALYHEYRGELSTAMGMVFVIEQEPLLEEQYPTMEGVLPPNAHLGDDLLSGANTLRAYEAESGRAVWYRGRGGPPTDELRSAHFCAAPVQAGSKLIAPYRIGGDFGLAVLERDGTLVRTVLLGSGRASLFPMNGVLPPAVHDGTIYVQTGAGLFFALDEHDFSLRWLTKYDTLERGRDFRTRGQWMFDDRVSVPQPDQWLSSPPVISSGVVVLTAHDADYLFGFDLDTGVEKWRVSRSGHRYLIGADESNVFMAGSKITAISLDKGETRWTTTRLHPTGRPIICGGDILTPTPTGLVRISTATGDSIGDTLATRDSLGNLFAMDGALYSVSAHQVSKYPDPNQTRILASARLEKNPDDIGALLRLAWLDTLDAKWSEASDYLDRADRALVNLSPESPIAGAQPNSRGRDSLASRVSHQRVFLLMRRAADAPDDERGNLLEQAVAAALRESDRLNAGLAYCEHLEDLRRYADAFSRGLSLLMEVGDEPMRIDAMLRIRADVLIAERLRQIWDDMPEEDRDDAILRIEEAIAAARSTNGRGQQVRLADALSFVSIGRQLDLEIGSRAVENGENETGIFFLERALLRSTLPSERLEPMLRLVVAYRFPGEGLPADPAAARRLLDRLEGEFSQEIMPSHVGKRTGLPTGSKVSDFVTAVRTTIPEPTLVEGRPIPRIIAEAERFALLREVIGPDGGRESARDGASFWDPSRPHDLMDEVHPIQLSGEIRGLDLKAEATDADAWVSTLRTGLEETALPIENRQANAFDAAIWGRVGVLATPAQVCSVGLASGRAMWAPLEVDDSAGPLPSPSVVGHGGIVVAAADAQSLVATYARDDATPIWRRTWARHAIGFLRIVDDCVVAIDRDAVRAFVVELSSGRIRGEYALVPEAGGSSNEEVDRADNDAHVAVVDRVVIRSRGDRIVGFDAKTGNSAWPVRPFEGLIKSIIELDHGCIGVSHGPNLFTLIKASSGEPVTEEPIVAVGLAMPPIDAVLEVEPGGDIVSTGRVILYTRTDESPPEFVLEWFPLNRKDNGWQRLLGPLATISRQMLRASPEFIAVIQNRVPPPPGERRQRPGPAKIDSNVPPKLVFFDKRQDARMIKFRGYELAEGELGSDENPTSPPLNSSRRILDVVVSNDRIVCVAPEGFFVLVDESMLPASREKKERGQ